MAGYLQFGGAAMYGTLYVTWVFVHLKRNDAADTVLKPSTVTAVNDTWATITVVTTHDGT